MILITPQVKGSSNFTQSLFNAVNVLMGIGLLSFPYAMRVTGLIPGLIISTMCALITNYTAKVFFILFFVFCFFFFVFFCFFFVFFLYVLYCLLCIVCFVLFVFLML